MNNNLSLLILMTGLVPAVKADCQGYSKDNFLDFYYGTEISIAGFGGRNSLSNDDILDQGNYLKEDFRYSFGEMISSYLGFGVKAFNVGMYASSVFNKNFSILFGLFVGGNLNNFLYRAGIGFKNDFYRFYCYENKIDVFVQLGYFFYDRCYIAVKANYFGFLSKKTQFLYSDFSVSLCLGYSLGSQEYIIEVAENQARATKLAKLQAELDFAEMQKNKKSKDKEN